MSLTNFLGKQFKSLGPGLITGASDDDPSGIAVYSQAGAQFGLAQIWTALFSFPFMAVIQEMCGRIGMVTGHGLSGVLRKYYSKPILYSAVGCILVANTINIGADLGAMAASTQLLFPIPSAITIVFYGLLIVVLQVFVSYTRYARILKYLTFVLFAYVITMFVVKQDWMQILLSVIKPTWISTQAFLFSIVGILGTTISPYLFFWQADQEVEEEVATNKIKDIGIGKPKFSLSDLRSMRKDTFFGMFFSNLTMFFIIGTTAATLYSHGITDIQTADQAASALRPLVGNFAFLLFTIGIVGTGLLAIPVLAGSSSYALSEALNWKIGLYKKLRQAPGFYGVIIFSVLAGLVINALPIPPFKLLYWAAILNGLCAPPLMVFILMISNNKKIMGKNTNSIFTNIMGVLITLIMAICGVFLLYSLLS